MWYEMTVTRRDDQLDFSEDMILPENSEYYKRVGMLNKMGILFAVAGPQFQSRVLKIRFERTDEPEIVKNAFSDWGQIKYNQIDSQY